MTNKSNLVEIPVGDRRLQTAEKAAVLLSIGGSVAGFIFQKYFLVFAPMSCALGLNFINRQKMLASVQKYGTQIEVLNNEHKSHCTMSFQQQEQHAKALQDLEKAKAELQEKLEVSQNKIEKVEMSLTEINQVSKNLDDSISELHKQQNDIDIVVQELRVLGNSDEKESDDESPANFYCKRGLIYHERQKYQQALKNFNHALQLDDNFAPAYHHSGLTYLNIGNKHKAFENLRKASKLYFNNNDLDKYHTVRKLSQKLYHNADNPQENDDVHHSADSSQDPSDQKIAVDDLFA